MVARLNIIYPYDEMIREASFILCWTRLVDKGRIEIFRLRNDGVYSSRLNCGVGGVRKRSPSGGQLHWIENTAMVAEETAATSASSVN
jgi:hypothetical protein